jgi:type VI secretion system protein ImpG
MFDRLFQQELSNLRDLGSEFARNHPAVAPMLSGLSTDPDVERLLEGVAFLTALLRQKLDDDFPEVVHELFQLIWPHFLRPIPAASVVAFSPKVSLKQTIRVPRGVQLASEPVDGTPCLFRTCYDTDVHPLSLVDAVLDDLPGHPPTVRLNFRLHDLKLSAWNSDSLCLHICGDPKQSADLYENLRRNLKRIILTPGDKGEALVLPPDHLKPVGFKPEDALIPYPMHSFPGYRLLQEYFILPEKFLFIEVSGLSRWLQKGDGDRFEIRFELQNHNAILPRVRKESFVLAATPVINIFNHDADPIRLDHRKTEYLIRPSRGGDNIYQVYNVTSVTGFVQGTAQERAYRPFEIFARTSEESPTYRTEIRQSPIRQGFDFFLSVAYPKKQETPPLETLSIQLQCTNGFLPEGLQIGDIRHATSSTPEFVEFRNIRPPTAPILPPVGKNLLWKLLSHLCLNYRTLASAQDLKALLGLYNFEDNRDRAAFLANEKRISGIQAVHSRAADRLVERVIMRGRELQLDVRQDHFAGWGDLYLFGSVLDYFLGSYASINTYTQLSIKELLKGEVYQWPARVGDHPLI